MKKIDLRSDTVTKPSPAMREAIANAAVGDDVFADDPTVNALQEKVAEMLGKQAALFFPSGVMSNQTALLAHTQPGDEILLEADCHIFYYESSGPAVHAQCMVRPLEGVHGALSGEAIARRIRPKDIHQARTRLVCVENTHNRAGGRIYPVETMRGVWNVARERGLKVHLDGARIFNAAVAKGVPVTQWTTLADTVNICLSKGLGAPVGSVLAGDAKTIERCRTIRKRMGGGMRQVGILAAAGLYALEHNIVRLAEDHANARRLAEGLVGLPGVHVDPQATETNIVLIHLEEECPFNAVELNAILVEQGVLLVEFGERIVRAVTHLDVSAADIDLALEAFRRVLG